MKATLAAALALAPIPFQQDFQEICGSRWVDRAAQLYCESRLDPNARSFDGGEGLGQATRIWPEYVRRGWVPADSNPFQPRPAIMGAHRYMIHLESRVRGWIPACGAYNAGERSVTRAQALADQAGLQAPDAWLLCLPQITKDKSSYTINYIRNIRVVRARWAKEGRG